MIAVDTNILVHAHRAEGEWHTSAHATLRELAEGVAPWTIPWPCVAEFFGIVTHQKIFDPPTPRELALQQVDLWLESPSVRLLVPTASIAWTALRKTLVAAAVTGPRVHDAKVAALCEAHGVNEIWTADRDFGRFTNISARNPLTAE